MDSIDSLFSLERFGIKLGLQNIESLCNELGRPQDAFRSVIIAGTNGKGSLTAMVDTALRSAGYRIGRYTSPHLVKLNERFVINGHPVSENDLQQEAVAVNEAIKRLQKNHKLAAPLTFFEATTAVALSLFRRTGIELALLEVGLGGRFDATNIVSPLAVAITSIDLDHEHYLGKTIDAIAEEKAGVIKPGVVVVIGESKTEATRVFKRVCHEHHAKLVCAKTNTQTNAKMQDGQLEVSLSTEKHHYGKFRLGLRGRHQIENAVVATRLLEELDTLGIPVPPQAIVQGLTEVVWRGRLELLHVGQNREILLDAAHNPAAASALASYLREVYPDRLPIICGIMQDKDAVSILQELAPCASRFICTKPSNNRSISAEKLANLALTIDPAIPVDIVPNGLEALQRAWEVGTTVCATGSIYIIGEIVAAIDNVQETHLA